MVSPRLVMDQTSPTQSWTQCSMVVERAGCLHQTQHTMDEHPVASPTTMHWRIHPPRGKPRPPYIGKCSNNPDKTLEAFTLKESKQTPNPKGPPKQPHEHQSIGMPLSLDPTNESRHWCPKSPPQCQSSSSKDCH